MTRFKGVGRRGALTIIINNKKKIKSIFFRAQKYTINLECWLIFTIFESLFLPHSWPRPVTLSSALHFLHVFIGLGNKIIFHSPKTCTYNQWRPGKQYIIWIRHTQNSIRVYNKVYILNDVNQIVIFRPGLWNSESSTWMTATDEKRVFCVNMRALVKRIVRVGIMFIYTILNIYYYIVRVIRSAWKLVNGFSLA